MARSKGRNKALPALDEDKFRPTRAHRKSDAAKRATAEAKKERRRQYYARDAEKIREKNRIHIAKTRAETTQASELTAAELEVSETLAQMQADRTQVSFHDAGGNSPTWRANAEIAIDKEITALWEEGERICPSDSDDEEGMEDLGETTKTDRNRSSLRARQRCRLLLLQTLGPRYSSRHSPSPDPPSPSPKTRLPSLYDKLFSTRREESERQDGPVDR
ncbi:hypothetical protein R3P38DRAFT_2780671 [Favolaschia claudopus]|uniref:BZIP domain-containing protein n=1 Tax=Favolaschia claudopus TaxID=2862362 RepID=A0AAW0BAK6_9AGAR